jgi:hypothetical protein
MLGFQLTIFKFKVLLKKLEEVQLKGEGKFPSFDHRFVFHSALVDQSPLVKYVND